MKMQISVVVSSDDDAVSRGAAGGLMLATRVEGVDPSSIKQDFLAQAETLMRSIGENQLPALYQSVLDECDRKAQEAHEAQAAEPTPEKAKVQAKLAKLRQRKEQAAASDTAAAQPEGEPAETHEDDSREPVQCTTCGAMVPHDEAHFVSVIQGGQYARDGVLCEACYRAEMRSAQAQQGEVQQ